MNIEYANSVKIFIVIYSDKIFIKILNSKATLILYNTQRVKNWFSGVNFGINISF